MKVAFRSNQLGVRGTEVALFDYARYNEEILGNESIIFSDPNANLAALDKFKERFDVRLMEWDETRKHISSNGFDYFYTTHDGLNRGQWLVDPPSLVHVVFRHNQPHGRHYVYISEWLAENMGYERSKSLPYICEPLPSTGENYRDTLGIPKDALVFGCYGGKTEFNIDFVQRACYQALQAMPNLYFVFANIRQFMKHERAIFLLGTYDMEEKGKFVDTCDAMIHARQRGETFGLAVAEFAMAGKPVVTYKHVPEKAHLEILGDYAITYENTEDLMRIFTDFSPASVDYALPYQKYVAPNVMQTFKTLISE